LSPAAFALALLAGQAEPALPELERAVTDQAGMLSSSEASALEQRLRAYRDQTGHQFALVTIPSLQGLPIEDYSIRLAEKWRLGDDDRDDGLLMVIAKEDRKIRIEVGYGLEGAIPDVIAKRVIADVMAPYFRKDQAGTGIIAGFEQLMRAAEGEAVKAPSSRDRDRSSGRRSTNPLVGLGLLVILALGFFVRRLLPAVFLAIMGLQAFGWPGLVGGALLGGFLGLAGGGGGWGGGPFIGGYYGGGFGGGGFGGGGFGGGGFGGGGGGFGGGGASGDW